MNCDFFVPRLYPLIIIIFLTVLIIIGFKIKLFIFPSLLPFSLTIKGGIGDFQDNCYTIEFKQRDSYADFLKKWAKWIKKTISKYEWFEISKNQNETAHFPATFSLLSRITKETSETMMILLQICYTCRNKNLMALK